MVTFEELRWNCSEEDYKQITSLLSEAFKYENTLSFKDFADCMLEREKGNKINTFVLRDGDGIIVGTATVILENKLLHNNAKVAHVEDVAIQADLRGYGYGAKLMDEVKSFAEDMGCYKIVLYCSSFNEVFYKKCGYRHTSALMRKDLS